MLLKINWHTQSSNVSYMKRESLAWLQFRMKVKNDIFRIWLRYILPAILINLQGKTPFLYFTGGTLKTWAPMDFIKNYDRKTGQYKQFLWWREHDDVIKWKHFPRYWPFVRGIHRSPVNSAHKGQWRGALMFTLICARINGWVNNRKAGDLRRLRAHYDVIVMRRVKIYSCKFGCLGARISSTLCKNSIFQCMGKIFCVEFQRKFNTKYLAHTSKDV